MYLVGKSDFLGQIGWADPSCHSARKIGLSQSTYISRGYVAATTVAQQPAQPQPHDPTSREACPRLRSAAAGCAAAVPCFFSVGVRDLRPEQLTSHRRVDPPREMAPSSLAAYFPYCPCQKFARKQHDAGYICNKPEAVKLRFRKRAVVMTNATQQRRSARSSSSLGSHGRLEQRRKARCTPPRRRIPALGGVEAHVIRAMLELAALAWVAALSIETAKPTHARCGALVSVGAGRRVVS
jgi:hypothetical protein